MSLIAKTHDLEIELIKTQRELENVLNKTRIYDDQITLIKEGSDLKFTYNRQLYKLQQQKLELERRYKPKLDDLKLKIKKLKEKISKIKESYSSTITRV